VQGEQGVAQFGVRQGPGQWGQALAQAIDRTIARRAAGWRVELTRFRGHLILVEKGVRDAQEQTAVSGGVSLAGHVAPAGAREQAGTETGLQRFEPAEQGRRIALEFAGGGRQFAVAGDGFDAAQVD
jgi:hypothetical protein